MKIHSPDYRGMNTDNALTDFIQRIEHYKQSYESLDEEKENEFSFIKIFNAGEKVLVHRHEGHIQVSRSINFQLIFDQQTARAVVFQRVSFFASSREWSTT